MVRQDQDATGPHAPRPAEAPRGALVIQLLRRGVKLVQETPHGPFFMHDAQGGSTQVTQAAVMTLIDEALAEEARHQPSLPTITAHGLMLGDAPKSPQRRSVLFAYPSNDPDAFARNGIDIMESDGWLRLWVGADMGPSGSIDLPPSEVSKLAAVLLAWLGAP